MGPSLTLTRPVKSSPVTESSAAPGMHGAIRSMSNSTRHASSTGRGTVNEFSSCTAGPPRPATPAPSRAGTCVDRDENATLPRAARPAHPITGGTMAQAGTVPDRPAHEGRTGPVSETCGGGQGAPGEHLREVLPVVGLGVEVVARAGALGGLGGGR